MLRTALVILILGGVLFALRARPVTAAGVFLIGLGAALLIQLVPALLMALHPGAQIAAVGEANGFASAASVIAPLAVGGAIFVGAGWRVGYLFPPIVVLALVLWLATHVELPSPSRRGANSEGRQAKFVGRWLDLVFAVSIEFCMVFWAAAAVVEWHGAALSTAPVVASLFLVGMAVGRAASAPATRAVSASTTLMAACTGIAALGFATFWLAPNVLVAGAGLLITGLGVALLYPLTISGLIAAMPSAPDRAAARAALGSGLAIGGAPFVLARLSDRVGLRVAYLIVPVLLGVLLLRSRLAAR
jgi:MFS family permease